jgi:hypothetical protein
MMQEPVDTGLIRRDDTKCRSAIVAREEDDALPERSLKKKEEVQSNITHKNENVGVRGIPKATREPYGLSKRTESPVLPARQTTGMSLHNTRATNRNKSNKLKGKTRVRLVSGRMPTERSPTITESSKLVSGQCMVPTERLNDHQQARGTESPVDIGNSTGVDF